MKILIIVVMVISGMAMAGPDDVNTLGGQQDERSANPQHPVLAPGVISTPTFPQHIPLYNPNKCCCCCRCCADMVVPYNTITGYD